MAKTCWLIVDRHGNTSLLTAQFAKLRGLKVRLIQEVDGTVPELEPSSDSLVVTSALVLEHLNGSGRLRLASFVLKGGTLYLRGGFCPGKEYPDLTFGANRIRTLDECRATRFYFTRSSLLPKALQDESFDALAVTFGAELTGNWYEELMGGVFESGRVRPIIFAQHLGMGTVFYDLTTLPDETSQETPLTTRLAEPSSRPGSVGALAAVDRVAFKEPRQPSAVGLVIDDRPANFDYFSTFPLKRLLSHLRSRLSGVHIDFAWVPSDGSPSVKYVETMKNFEVGFVWHGFARHVDHRTIADLVGELESGKRMVSAIMERYGVRFQPVMVFPFERSNAAAKRVLEEHGFIACAEAPKNPALDKDPLPPYLFSSVAGIFSPSGNFVTLYRYPVEYFTADMMLARASLGLPIIAAAHPGDVALRRLSPLRFNSGSVSHFDFILDFAAKKGLRPRSLEEIAREVIEESPNSRVLAQVSG